MSVMWYLMRKWPFTIVAVVVRDFVMSALNSSVQYQSEAGGPTLYVYVNIATPPQSTQVTLNVHVVVMHTGIKFSF